MKIERHQIDFISDFLVFVSDFRVGFFMSSIPFSSNFAREKEIFISSHILTGSIGVICGQSKVKPRAALIGCNH